MYYLHDIYLHDIYYLFCHLHYAAVRSFDRQIVINLSSVQLLQTLVWRMTTKERSSSGQSNLT